MENKTRKRRNFNKEVYFLPDNQKLQGYYLTLINLFGPQASRHF